MTDDRVNPHEGPGHTSSSLLVRIKQKDQEAWRRLVLLYSPLVSSWCAHLGLQEADAADVGQDVFRKVAEAIGGFRHDRPGDSFRAWLRTITRNRILDHFREKAKWVGGAAGVEAQARLLEVEDRGEESGLSGEDERRILVRRAIDLVLEDCKEGTRQAFLRVVIGGQHPSEVARDLGMTANAVYLAKSRILRRIRDEFEQLVEI